MEALLDAGAPLPVEAMNAETWPEVAPVVLASTGLDSLAAVEVAMAIEDELEIFEIPDDDLRACVTVGDLARAATMTPTFDAARRPTRSSACSGATER